MQNSEVIQHPVIAVAIDGVAVDTRPTKFYISTLCGCPSVLPNLFYPANSEVGKAGDKITVSLITDDKTDLYFTGKIYLASSHDAMRELVLTDSYHKLYITPYTAAYRKEKAAHILDDILGAAGITEKNITCPDIELARFSTERVMADYVIKLLIDALKAHGVEGLTFFFDEKDIFHFGTKDDGGKIRARFSVLKAARTY